MSGVQPTNPDDVLQQLARGMDPLFLKFYSLTKPRGFSDVSEGMQHLYQSIQDAAALTQEVRDMRKEIQNMTQTIHEATTTMQEATQTLKSLFTPRS